MEIGSNFWLNPYEDLHDYPLNPPERFGCKGSDYAWFSTGRSATSFVLTEILKRNPSIKRHALLPSFTCYTVIQPFINAGFQVDYYNIDYGLLADAQLLCELARTLKVGVVLFHHYFGFNTISNINSLITLKQEGIITIEDCTQCLYSSFNRSEADFFVASIRKWLGTPDGGFAVCRDGLLNNKPQHIDFELERAKIEASFNKYKYLFEGKGRKELFLKQYHDAEDILDNQDDFYTISPMSSKVQMNLNVQWMKTRRIKNYLYLHRYLSSHKALKPIFSTNSDETPLYFPIIVRNRQAVQKILANNEIYAPIVWPKPDSLRQVCQSAEFLYNNLLCLPIDQRYDEDDMERIINVLEEVE